METVVKKHIHTTYHDFTKHFKDNNKFKYNGWDMMVKLEKWAQHFPKDVALCRIDDSFHASSTLGLISHKDSGEYWGTTVVVVTQCDGQNPCEFFLYPENARELIKGLAKVKTRR